MEKINNKIKNLENNLIGVLILITVFFSFTIIALFQKDLIVTLVFSFISGGYTAVMILSLMKLNELKEKKNEQRK